MAPRDAAASLAGCRVLALATYDSFAKAAAATGAILRDAGADVRHELIRLRRNQISDAQKARMGLPRDLPARPLAHILEDPEFEQTEVVISALDGRRSRELFLAMKERGFGVSRPRPIVVSIYPGIVFREHLNGFMDRAPADVLCFNTEPDKLLYERAAAELGIDPSNALVTGLLMLATAKTERKPSARPSIVYFDQPTVPRHRVQRMYLLHALAERARRYPEADWIISPRTRPEEKTLHRTRFHLETLLRKQRRRESIPQNLRISYAPTQTLLESAHLVLTVSSTAALEAMVSGIPTGILTDFGIAEHLGNHYFLGSKALVCAAEVSPGTVPSVDKRWLTGYGANIEPLVLIRRLSNILRTRSRQTGGSKMRDAWNGIGHPTYRDFASRKHGTVSISSPEALDEPCLHSLVALTLRRL